MPEVDDLGHGRLHAKRQFVRLDAGPKLRVVGVFDAGQAIEPAQQVELGRLLLARHVRSGRGERQRVFRVDGQANAVVLGAEVVAAVPVDAAAAIGERRAQHDELRQVVVERTQPVMDPRADRREWAPSSACRPVWNWSWAPWSLSVVHIERTIGEVVDVRRRRAATSR